MAMKIEEMFPTKNEQRLAQRVIETLKNCPGNNTIEIGKRMWPEKTPSARLACDPALYQVLKSLQSLNIVICRINPFSISYFEKDHFTLNQNAEEALTILYNLHKARPYSPAINDGFRYIVFACSFCGAAVGARNSQKSATCIRCNHKNNLKDKSLEILLRTNNVQEASSAIKDANTQSRGLAKSRPE